MKLDYITKSTYITDKGATDTEIASLNTEVNNIK